MYHRNLFLRPSFAAYSSQLSSSSSSSSSSSRRIIRNGIVDATFLFFCRTAKFQRCSASNIFWRQLALFGTGHVTSGSILVIAVDTYEHK